MIYKKLGNSGLKVSAIGFGNWITGHEPEAI
jgi:aryl-alcohol dehydrogenase-like predicted oxidoreductase